MFIIFQGNDVRVVFHIIGKKRSFTKWIISWNDVHKEIGDFFNLPFTIWAFIVKILFQIPRQQILNELLKIFAVTNQMRQG